jgi:diadenosine tetraphosphatase ApaH/serine/threonine PP2A family protein phosphatase
MIAILSDIHGNLEALRAVLADARRAGAVGIYCLGDVVGYGPNPRECLDLARDFCLTLLGNHDQAALFDPAGFSPVAERAIFWARGQLESSPEPRSVREGRWEFLADRPRVYREKDLLFVHASARNPLNEYVFPEDICNERKMERIFALVERYCFQGHTHIPGVFVQQAPDDQVVVHHPDEVGHVYRLNGRKTLVNVGSVGQPRDGDPRACYVLLEDDLVRFRRVEYDVEATVRKIHAVPDLDPFLGNRLFKGQ